MKTMKDVPKYLIYDGRYRFDEDRAIVMDMEDDFEDAIRSAKSHGDAVVVESKTGEVVWSSDNE